MSELTNDQADVRALDRYKRLHLISGLVRMAIAFAGFCYVFIQSGSWLNLLILVVSLVIFILGIGSFVSRGTTQKLFTLIQQGETSVAGIAAAMNQKEESVVRDLKALVRARILPGATITEDAVLLAPSPDEVLDEMPSDDPAEKIDLNTATEQQLATLPGIGVVLAKKVVAERERQNGFDSVEQFLESMEIMPHFAVQIEELVFVDKPQKPKTPAVPISRVVDV